ncbi:hypothetical protein R1flu_017197 [Riccia fluitans]|uniref:Uncharacterized protein n=1 Tax=Riccia fluitans TaxID=41844 RepID=A0ABD1XDS6_9MARC
MASLQLIATGIRPARTMPQPRGQPILWRRPSSTRYRLLPRDRYGTQGRARDRAPTNIDNQMTISETSVGERTIPRTGIKHWQPSGDQRGRNRRRPKDGM